MKKLVDLTDWQEYKAERGRGAGNSIKYRLCVCADLWNWCLSEEYPDGRIVGKSFAGNMRVFLTLIPEELRKDAIPKIIKALAEKTEMTVEMNLDQSLPDLGTNIDDVFNVSFMREHPPTVYQRLFKETE